MTYLAFSTDPKNFESNSVMEIAAGSQSTASVYSAKDTHIKNIEMYISNHTGEVGGGRGVA